MHYKNAQVLDGDVNMSLCYVIMLLYVMGLKMMSVLYVFLDNSRKIPIEASSSLHVLVL